MIVTDDKHVYERAEMLRRHGGKVKYRHTELGLNSRLDELQAAILRVKLKHLDKWISQRRRNAYTYNRLLSHQSDVQCPAEQSDSGPHVAKWIDQAEEETVRSVFHQYTIQVADRDGVRQVLGEAGIGSAVYYPVPLHLQEVHRDLGYKKGAFPAAEKVSDCCLSLPMFPELSLAQQEAVVDALCAIGAGRPYYLLLDTSATTRQKRCWQCLHVCLCWLASGDCNHLSRTA